MRMIRAVTFDCWGTLINDTRIGSAYDVRLEALIDASDGRLDEESGRELLDRSWREHHRSWIGGVQYGAPGMARFCMTTLAIDDDLRCDRLQEAFEEAGRHGDLVALPGATETLRILREAGLRTALVCDTGLTPGRVVREFLDDLGLLSHLEFCAFSNEIGEPKPSPVIFLAALAAISAEAAEAAHVGDLLRTDVYGARDVGMATVRITAVNDDAATRFSWDPNASFGSTSTSGNAHPDELDDADEVVSSHAELAGALRRLGASI